MRRTRNLIRSGRTFVSRACIFLFPFTRQKGAVSLEYAFTLALASIFMIGVFYLFVQMSRDMLRAFIEMVKYL
ncbi:MAG: hypothetical protein CSA22_02500 [Deltaproteobacteria bacterium]|nr:MAG: hypothetical protein CSA22_02500 [Deltaproteobacteria bacterium]